MKKTLLSFALIAACVAASATAIHPVQEVNYRTNNAEPTAWSFVKVADGTNQKFEVKHSARIFVVQSWAIPGISNATELNIYYTREAGQTNDGTIAIWAFPYDILTTNTFSVEQGSFLDNVKTVLGIYPGDTAISKLNQPLVKSVAGTDSASNHARVLSVDANAIKALKTAGKISGDTLYVNILLNTLKADNDLNYKYYSIGSSEKVNYMLVSAASPAVSNLTSGVGYSTLAAAVAAAAADDILQINEDVTISGNRVENNVALTIQGKTGNEKILRATDLDNITLLPKKALTLKNLVLDGQNVNRKKPAVEVGSAFVTFDNVTIQNYKRTDADQKQGIVVIKSNGKALFKNTTFANNAVATGYGDIFNGLNKALILDGNNIIPNGIFIEKSHAILDSTATHTVAIDLRVETSRTVGGATALVLNTTDASKYNLIVDGKDWSIAAGESFLYIKDNATSVSTIDATEAKAVKVIKDGKLYIRQGNVLYDVLGGKQ